VERRLPPCLHTLLTAERLGYYQDFGTLAHLRDALAQGYVYAGQYSAFASAAMATRRATSRRTICRLCAEPRSVGNRMLGERLSRLVTFEALKVAASVVLLSPCLPLLFMGRNSETAPFPYFISHLDAAWLRRCVAVGGRSSALFTGREHHQTRRTTLLSEAKLNHHLRQQDSMGCYALIQGTYALTPDAPALAQLRKDCMEVMSFEESKLLACDAGAPMTLALP